MATHTVSPGGNLLRSSRFFSIPPPLPKPMNKLRTSGIFASETATSPYPTHLAITTPPSSLSRGDWGLKRPLPLRATAQTSTPHIRVMSVDTWEHVTEFESAANHTLTLQKWQEMNLPLSTPGDSGDAVYLSSYKTRATGVFEDMSGSKAKKDSLRWKFKGPWLAGLTATEFNEYIRKEIQRRKPEFQEFLRQVKAREDTKIAQREGRKAPEAIKPSDITDEQLRQYIRELRYDRPTLFNLIRKFFDFPPSSAKLDAIQEYVDKSRGLRVSSPPSKMPTINSKDFLSDSDSPYAVSGPPKTHPSSGLSYLRTGSKIYNHPVYGPQQQPPPIQGRVIQPKNSIGVAFAKIGIAGVVADTPRTMDNYRTKGTGQLSYPGLLNIEPNVKGGSKIWLCPTLATMDPQGRINLKLAEANPPPTFQQGAPSLSTRKVTAWQPKSLAKPLKPASGGYGLETFDVLNDKIRTVKDDEVIDEFLAKAALGELMDSDDDSP
jgi:hypothetical protein